MEGTPEGVMTAVKKGRGHGAGVGWTGVVPGALAEEKRSVRDRRGQMS